MIRSTASNLLRVAAALCLFLTFAGTTTVHAQGTEAVHLGVQTCAASTCHGAAQPWQNSTVMQNEFIIWSNHDSHSRAYAALLSDHGKQIAAKLGIGAAEKASVCLDCHTDNVAAELRGKNFNVTEGVGCETCHGGAENWLGIHVSGVGSREDLAAAGMYQTADPVARAELCVSCHQPNPDRLVSHKLISAGHPRLTFELDTFSVNQPSHARFDDDYRQRKTVHDHANLWAIGQAVSAREQMHALAKSMESKTHLFPELAFFECGSCHHPYDNAQWQTQPGVGLGPGEPQLHDANLVMLRGIAAAIDPSIAGRLKSQTRALHQATRNGAGNVARAANSLADTAEGLAQRLAASPLDANALRTTLTTLMSRQHAAEYADFGSAEQVTMAIASILETLDDSRGGDMLERIYTAADNPARFSSRGFAQALTKLRETLK
jgi:hypothetical protein